MKSIEVDEDIYTHIAANTVEIGERASSILRRLLGLNGQEANTQNSETDEKHEFSEFLESGKLRFGAAVEKFLTILGEAHKQKPEEFSVVLSVQGRGRLYFARTREEIVASGNSTHPKRIPGSEFWVLTNSPTSQKRQTLRQVLERMNYSPRACSEVIATLKFGAAKKQVSREEAQAALDSLLGDL